ncbi:nucleotidyltransferase-like protein [Domibacillus indicus]|uniref:nucleotidyltransferase-like protein n=1 Tax=Domibacillus indicus TaxID=1437523 RepID=UPI0006181CD3|nr:nucleotidyltransferase-like protein [Domibacillus indicus]
MEDLLRPLYQERTSQQNTLGVLAVQKNEQNRAFTENFDSILLIIVKEAEEAVFIKHYVDWNEETASMYIVTEAKLREWLLLGSNRKVVEWLYHGRILFDRNEYVQGLKTEMREFPFYGRKIKMAIEFAKLIKRYTDGKAFFNDGHFLDAYNHVLHSLHHLARLSVIENGFYPELTVWNQIRHIEPGIYKLYEELLTSDEDLEKRLELLFLASEFMIHSRTERGADHLLTLMKEKEWWSINELLNHEEIVPYAVDLVTLMEYLIDRQLVQVISVQTKGQGVFHRYYQVRNN